MFFHKILPMFAEHSNSFAKSTSCKGLDMKQKEKKLPYYINKEIYAAISSFTPSETLLFASPTLPASKADK